MEKNILYIRKEFFLYRKITVSTLKTSCRGNNSKQQMLSVPSPNIKNYIINPILLTNQKQLTMKKTVFLLFAFMAAITAFGQDNLALNKAAIATSGNASAAVDGNTNGTRWESSFSDPQTWAKPRRSTPSLSFGRGPTLRRLLLRWAIT